MTETVAWEAERDESGGGVPLMEGFETAVLRRETTGVSKERSNT